MRSWFPKNMVVCGGRQEVALLKPRTGRRHSKADTSRSALFWAEVTLKVCGHCLTLMTGIILCWQEVRG